MKEKYRDQEHRLVLKDSRLCKFYITLIYKCSFHEESIAPILQSRAKRAKDQISFNCSTSLLIKDYLISYGSLVFSCATIVFIMERCCATPLQTYFPPRQTLLFHFRNDHLAHGHPKLEQRLNIQNCAFTLEDFAFMK